MFGWFKRDKKHQADVFFKQKFKTHLTRDGYKIVEDAYNMRHEYPDLSGPELIRLSYWGVSGNSE
jgi:hypothetical protein